jgi:hypothetical protein
MDNNFDCIRFGSGKAMLLTNRKMCDGIYNKISKYYHIQLDFKKGYNKYSVPTTNRDIKNIKRAVNEYMICYNFNVEFSYLFLTQYSGINFCFYLLSDGRIVSVKHRFSDSLYEKDTMFEGQIIDNYYIISDLVIHDGHTYQAGIPAKISRINKIMDNQYVRSLALDSYRIEVKDHVYPQFMESLVTTHYKSQLYKNHVNGILFRHCINDKRFRASKNPVPERQHLYIGKSDLHFTVQDEIDTNNEISKRERDGFNKYCLRQRVTFKLKKTEKPDIYNLYIQRNRHDYFFDIADVSNLKTSRLIRKMFEKNPRYHYIIVNCEYYENFGRWQPISTSSKPYPDNIDRYLK